MRFLAPEEQYQSFLLSSQVQKCSQNYVNKVSDKHRRRELRSLLSASSGFLRSLSNPFHSLLEEGSLDLRHTELTTSLAFSRAQRAASVLQSTFTRAKTLYPLQSESERAVFSAARRVRNLSNRVKFQAPLDLTSTQTAYTVVPYLAAAILQTPTGSHMPDFFSVEEQSDRRIEVLAGFLDLLDKHMFNSQSQNGIQVSELRVEEFSFQAFLSDFTDFFETLAPQDCTYPNESVLHTCVFTQLLPCIQSFLQKSSSPSQTMMFVSHDALVSIHSLRSLRNGTIPDLGFVYGAELLVRGHFFGSSFRFLSKVPSFLPHLFEAYSPPVLGVVPFHSHTPISQELSGPEQSFIQEIFTSSSADLATFETIFSSAPPHTTLSENIEVFRRI